MDKPTDPLTRTRVEALRREIEGQGRGIDRPLLPNHLFVQRLIATVDRYAVGLPE